MTSFIAAIRLATVVAAGVLLPPMGGCTILTDHHAPTSAASACLSQTGAPGSRAYAHCMVREYHLLRGTDPTTPNS